MQEQLVRFLTEQVGSPVSVEDLQRVSSVGNAREPWSFTARWQDGARRVEQRCVMLVKAAAGQLDTALRTEFDTIARLDRSAVAVPPACWIDETGEAIGAPFFVTGWVAGTADTRVLRRPEGDPAIAAVARQLAGEAARLHALAPALFDHLDPTSTTGAAPAQLAHWEDVFRRQRLEAHPALCYVLRWLSARFPTATRVSLVHGDLRFGNLLYDGDRLTALLDWEMTHLGDPLEDLAWVYRDLWTPERSLPFEAFLRAYLDHGGGPIDPEHLRWYQVFAEFKHSVISLTAARSFDERGTLSLRHADRSATVPAFVRRAFDLLQRDTVPC